MTTSDWLRECSRMTNLWPHQPVLPGAAREGYPFLAHLSPEQVKTSIDALLMDGLEFAPTAGQIILKAAELQEPRLLFGEAYAEIQHNVRIYGNNRSADEIPWSSPLVAELVRQKGWTEMCLTTDDPSTVEAQTRMLWDALKRRRIQDRAYRPLGDAGFVRLLELRQLPQHGDAA
jgi:hypothetical protein